MLIEILKLIIFEHIFNGLLLAILSKSPWRVFATWPSPFGPYFENSDSSLPAKAHPPTQLAQIIFLKVDCWMKIGVIAFPINFKENNLSKLSRWMSFGWKTGVRILKIWTKRTWPGGKDSPRRFWKNRKKQSVKYMFKNYQFQNFDQHFSLKLINSSKEI